MFRAGVLSWIPLIAACGASGPVPMSDGGAGGHTLCLGEELVGDPTLPIELQLMSGIERPQPLAADAVLDSFAGGGAGLSISVRAANVDRCAVAFDVRVTDLTAGGFVTGGAFAELVASSDGWAEPLAGAPDNFVNVPLLAGHVYRLTVLAQDGTGRFATTALVTRLRSA